MKHRDPLTTTAPPEHIWEDLAADHWGPTPEGKHLLVVIHKLSRYSEVEVVNGTGAETNIEALDTIFSRHGYCKPSQQMEVRHSTGMTTTYCNNTLAGQESNIKEQSVHMQMTQKQMT